MRTVLILFVLLCSICFSSCREERPTSVTVGVGPSFSLAGSGRLASFTIYAPQSGERIAFPHPDVSITMWRIEAAKGFFKGDHVQDFQLSYGKVPQGYRQVVPNQSQSAPPLSPGVVYSFFAESTNAPVADGYFYIDGKEPIQTKIPDLCLMLLDGREVRIDCGTKQRYREPSNLREIVFKHRTGGGPH